MKKEKQMLNRKIVEPPAILEGCIDRSFGGTIYNHFEDPVSFMEAVVSELPSSSCGKQATDYITKGQKLYERIDEKDVTYDKKYRDVAEKVRAKLLARGFTTSMLYSSVEFTTENTGCMSKVRAMLGRRDCYYKNPSVNDGKLFHDIYVNLSYSAYINDSTIVNNSYALYALTAELARIIPMRVIVVNHVGTDTPTCYSYVLKKFGLPLNPKEFLFFTSDSKRTFGWATYDILNGGNSSNSTVGQPDNTVSIADFNLDKEIDSIFVKIKAQAPELFRVGE